MQTATLSNDGRITIPAALRRQYGWRDGAKGVITPSPDGFVFSFSSAKPKKQALKKAVKEWTLPEPRNMGPFLAPVEQWRELANERPLVSEEE